MSNEPSIQHFPMGEGITKILSVQYVGDEKVKKISYRLDGKKYKTLEAARAARASFRKIDKSEEAKFLAQEAAKGETPEIPEE